MLETHTGIEEPNERFMSRIRRDFTGECSFFDGKVVGAAVFNPSSEKPVDFKNRIIDSCHSAEQRAYIEGIWYCAYASKIAAIAAGLYYRNKTVPLPVKAYFPPELNVPLALDNPDPATGQFLVQMDKDKAAEVIYAANLTASVINRIGEQDLKQVKDEVKQQTKKGLLNLLLPLAYFTPMGMAYGNETNPIMPVNRVGAIAAAELRKEIADDSSRSFIAISKSLDGPFAPDINYSHLNIACDALKIFHINQSIEESILLAVTYECGLGQISS